MESLVCTEPFRLEYVSSSMPAAGRGEALLRVRRIGVCGTDLHAFEGMQPYFTYPRILGHELAGEIVRGSLTGPKDFTDGEAVTIIPYFACGNCIACAAGKPNACVRLNVCGVHSDGGMREYFVVPETSLVHGEGLSLDELALVEPLAIGAHGVRRAQVKPGEFVLVVGAGPIGLATMEFARIAGGTVIAMDVNTDRLAFCRDRLRVPHTVNATDPDVSGQLRSITSGDMPAVVIDATGNLTAINNAFNYLAHGGRYILIGLQKGDIHFSHPEFHKREATLASSRNATREDFAEVMTAIRAGIIDPSQYITHRVTFAGARDSFAGWLDPANGVIKAMISV